MIAKWLGAILICVLIYLLYAIAHHNDKPED
jgi:hypothetical protein